MQNTARENLQKLKIGIIKDIKDRNVDVLKKKHKKCLEEEQSLMERKTDYILQGRKVVICGGGEE